VHLKVNSENFLKDLQLKIFEYIRTLYSSMNDLLTDYLSMVCLTVPSLKLNPEISSIQTDMLKRRANLSFHNIFKV
jgi:hypothetical protein